MANCSLGRSPRPAFLGALAYPGRVGLPPQPAAGIAVPLPGLRQRLIVTFQQAFEIVNSRKQAPKSVHFLACGFEPLHLASFFRAHLCERLPERDAEVRTGVFGDLIGNLILAAESSAVAAAVALEWSDIDPRLGLRSTGGWSREAVADIVVRSAERYALIEPPIGTLAARMPVAVAAPSLPLPPIGGTIRDQAGALELECERLLAEFLSRISQLSGVRIVRRRSSGDTPGVQSALDAKMEILAGFPYTLAYASQLAESLAGVLYQKTPKKALITDLDETLWAGIVGEVGPDGVSWDIGHHSQTHGLYQQMIGHLADQGVLVGVCTKNEISVVEPALARKDLFFDAQSLFPIRAGWGPKSESIGRILESWNIGAEAVVFVDDSPMELEEAQRAYPQLTCLRFQGGDPYKVWDLLGNLRDLFGKPALMEEDRLRRKSLQAEAEMRKEMAESGASPDFLRGLDGTVTLDWRPAAAGPRALDLINKTNQFNLNGMRIAEGEWKRMFEDPGRICGVLSYRDRFGPLGAVAVLVGTRAEGKLAVSHWVMSCRAFSRMLESHVLDALFRRFDVDEMELAFHITGRNQPLQRFFQSIGVRDSSDGGWRLLRSDFTSQCGGLPHRVEELTE